MPQEKLASLNLERSILNWQNCLERGEPFFVAVMDGRVLGFVSGGKNRSNESCETGKGDACDCELAAMYLLKDFQGLGIGKALFQSFREEMRKQSYQSM
jgi:GNAT superfamily N-acetyltransferase